MRYLEGNFNFRKWRTNYTAAQLYKWSAEGKKELKNEVCKKQTFFEMNFNDSFQKLDRL